MKALFVEILKLLLSILENYRWQIFGLIYAFGVGVYYFICKVKGIVAIYQAFALFAMSLTPYGANGCDIWIHIAGLMAAFYTVISVVSLVAKRYMDIYRVDICVDEEYILVCGLGVKASAYIDSELLLDPKVNILAIEKDIQNPNIEKYRALGIAIKVADASDIDILGTLNIKNAKHIVALAGRDISNLEIALSLSIVIKANELDLKKLYLHIDDRGLDKFYKDGGLLDDNAKLEVKMFSMSRNGAKGLFLEHTIDGESSTYIDSQLPFGLVVVGYSRLALEVIGQICELAHLPNENLVTIYCIDENVDAFQRAVEYRYANIDKIPTINLEYISLSHDERSFYTHTVWNKELTNIILCHRDAQINLDIASELADSTYLQKIMNHNMKSKIHIAIYENKMIADNIDENQEHFKYFDVFAQTSQILSREMIVDEKFEMIAQCIHAGYEMRYNPDAMFSDEDAITKAWNKTANLVDRVSSRAQAYHIPMKLKTIGLAIKLSDMNISELLLYNQKMFEKSVLYTDLVALKLDKISMTERTKDLVGDNAWNTEGFEYFPEAYTTLMEKLLKAEHNRWNAHHWLKGWKVNEIKVPELKQHDCLVPLDDLPKSKRHTIIYDIYSVLYIPNLLTKVGYELVEIPHV